MIQESMRSLPEEGINLEDSIKHDGSNSFLTENYITSFGGLYQVMPYKDPYSPGVAVF